MFAKEHAPHWYTLGREQLIRKLSISFRLADCPCIKFYRSFGAAGGNSINLPVFSGVG